MVVRLKDFTEGDQTNSNYAKYAKWNTVVLDVE